MAAAIRCLGRTTARTLLRTSEVPQTALAPVVICLKNQTRNEHINIDFSKIKIDQLNESQLTDFEVSKDPNEWKFVERIMPLQCVPIPKQFDGPAPSGWTSPKEEAKKLPYFIQRNKNHMQPVYLVCSYRYERKITVIRKIQGDIWQLEKDIRAHLEKYRKVPWRMASRVNEMAGKIMFKGDQVAYIKQWMDMKGF